jgi:hypothetical protein
VANATPTTAPATSPDAAAPPTARRSVGRWISGVLVAVVIAPLLVAAVHQLANGAHYVPVDDLALMELRTRDVFHHPVLTGPYSRFGWNHPGGLIYYLLAVPYWLSGSRSIGLVLGALLVNGATIGAIGALAHRRGGVPVVAATMLPVLLYTHAVGWSQLTSPWNPYLPTLAFLLLLLLVWSVTVGDLWMAPPAMAVASFCVQSHVGFAVGAGVLAVLATGAVVGRGIRTRADDRGAYWRHVARVAGVTVGVGVVLWLPVVVGDLRSDDSNFARLARFFTSGQPVAGFRFGLELMGTDWGGRPDWIFGSRPVGFLGIVGVEPRWWVAPLLVLGLAATAIAWRRRAWDTVWFAAVVGVGLLAALLATSRATGAVYPYLVRWTWIPGVALGTLVLLGGWLAVPAARRPAVGRVALPVVAAGMLVLAGLEVASALDASPPGARGAARVTRLTRDVRAALPPGSGPVVLDLRRGSQDAGALALQLERHGIPVEVDSEHAYIYGPEREAGRGARRATLVFVAGRPDAPPGRLVSRWTHPVSARDRHEAARLMDAMAAALGRPLTSAERQGFTPQEDVQSVYLAPG